MKRIVSLLTLSFIFCLTPTSASIIPKTGAICSKQGLTITYNGKRYTCTKTGKKLVWGKGVVIPVSKKTTPTPSQTRSASASRNYATEFSNPAILQSFTSLMKYIQSNSEVPKLENITFVIDPETPFPGEKLIKEKLSLSTRLYKIADPNAEIPLRVYIYNSKNFDELANLMRQDLTGEALQGGWLEAKAERARKEWRGFFGGASPGYGNDGIPVLFYNLNPIEVSSYVGLHVYIHEYVHVYQRYLLGNMQRMTCWMREGQATYLGFNLAALNEQGFVYAWRALYQYLSPDSDTSDFYTKSERDWIDWLNSQEKRLVTECDAISNYVYGAILWSYLYGHFGIEKTNAFLTNVAKFPVSNETPINAPGDSWKKSFIETFGITPESEYPKIAEYFVREAKWVKKWRG